METIIIYLITVIIEAFTIYETCKKNNYHDPWLHTGSNTSYYYKLWGVE